MKEFNLPPLYVGQKVVCVKAHSRTNALKVGQIYTVLDIHLFSCGCYSVYVGIKIPSYIINIKFCETHNIEDAGNGSWYMNPNKFAPVERPKYSLMSFEKIKEKEQQEILIDN